MTPTTPPQKIKSKLLPFILGTAFGIVLFAGCLIGYLNKTAQRDKRVYFKVWCEAASPKGMWYGTICSERNNVDAIVDFGEELKLAKGDSLEGSYLATNETGLAQKYSETRTRIYKLQGKARMLDVKNN
jgi:hypothetical protein